MKEVLLYLKTRPILFVCMFSSCGLLLFLIMLFCKLSAAMYVVLGLLLATLLSLFLIKRMVLAIGEKGETLIKVSLENTILEVAESHSFKDIVILWKKKSEGRIFRLTENLEIVEGSTSLSGYGKRGFRITLPIQKNGKGNVVLIPVHFDFYFKEPFEKEDWKEVVEKVLKASDDNGFYLFFNKKIKEMVRSRNEEIQKEINSCEEKIISREELKKAVVKISEEEAEKLKNDFSFIKKISVLGKDPLLIH